MRHGRDLPATPAHLACLIDRLALAGSDDPALTALFAAAERRRVEGCGAPGPGGRHPPPGGCPALRSRARP